MFLGLLCPTPNYHPLVVSAFQLAHSGLLVGPLLFAAVHVLLSVGSILHYVDPWTHAMHHGHKTTFAVVLLCVLLGDLLLNIGKYL